MISVDRVQDNICKPYQYLKSTIYEERLQIYENTLLTEELIGLERNNNTGKIDHSPSGINSKDSCDALCGAVFNASLHADEFAFDYGETLENIVDTSKTRSAENEKKQISIDFQNELNRIFDPMTENNKKNIENNERKFLNFGMGSATSNFNAQYASQGIIII